MSTWDPSEVGLLDAHSMASRKVAFYALSVKIRTPQTRVLKPLCFCMRRQASSMQRKKLTRFQSFLAGMVLLFSSGRNQLEMLENDSETTFPQSTVQSIGENFEKRSQGIAKA